MQLDDRSQDDCFYEKVHFGQRFKATSSRKFRGDIPYLLVILKKDATRHKHRVPVPSVKYTDGSTRTPAVHSSSPQAELPTLLRNSYSSCYYQGGRVSAPSFEEYMSKHLGENVSALFYRAIEKDENRRLHQPQTVKIARLDGRSCVGGMLVCACVDGDTGPPDLAAFDDDVNWFGSWFGLKKSKCKEEAEKQQISADSIADSMDLLHLLEPVKILPKDMQISDFVERHDNEVQKVVDSVQVSVQKARDAASHGYKIAEECRMVEQEVKRLIAENEGPFK
mmetsp:Transcript_39453/g.63227  ORF Transcript_39453/g.63227 Transcript_39453/m.63227 type:complete len:280 (-) Transcript_39453:115-954(-)